MLKKLGSKTWWYYLNANKPAGIYTMNYIFSINVNTSVFQDRYFNLVTFITKFDDREYIV